MNCLICETEVRGAGVKYCSPICKEKGQELKKQKALIEKSKNLKGTEGIDYITCKWCECRVKRIYGTHIKKHHKDKNINDYRTEFPNENLTCLTDKKNTSKNSGIHMKDYRYRTMMSEKVKGINNPNHKSKTTEEYRKTLSPFSKSFKGYINIKDKERAVSDFAKKALSNRLTETNLEYWKNKYGDNETAICKYRERQRTFTLAKCIEKYKKDKGTEVWEKRNKEWGCKINDMYKNGEFVKFSKNNHSTLELEFIGKIVDNLKCNNKYYSALNGVQFFRYFSSQKITHSYDFVIGNKIIEFNGDYWHCNPNIYQPTYTHKVIGLSAKDIWEADNNKKKLIEQEGFLVMVVWESEYKSNPIKTIEKCINFIYDKKAT